MPLFTRTIQPVAVSRIEVDSSIQNELECVTNNTLSNIIRQLSSLSKHAEDLFTDLSQEANNVFTRSSSLQHRIDNVRDKVTQLNATVEEVSLQDIHLRKPFKSSVAKEQQVISRNTIPRSILENYTKCTQPPALDKLNQFREDGKDSMKFYTDPGYFFELWVAEMEKDFQHKKAELHKKRQKRRPRDQTSKKTVRQVNTKREQWNAMKYGEELSNYHVPDTKKRIESQKIPANMVQINSTPIQQTQRPDSINLKKQNSVTRTDSQKQNQHQHVEKHDISSNKPIQNGPAHIPYNNQAEPHTNQMTNHMGYDPRSHLSSPQNRPSERPPAPPSGGKDSPSAGRDILPPPPPPPPADNFQHTSSPYKQAQHQQLNDTRNTGSPHHLVHQNSAKSSPARHPIFASAHVMDQSMDLPPPPLSPKDTTPDTPVSMDSMPPPPSPPPPLDQYPATTNMIKAPSPPPPPPPPPPPLDARSVPNGHLRTTSSQLDEASISSSGSTVTTISNSMGKAEADRSALLDEIRMGTRLKKLNRLEEKEEKKKMPSWSLDVQAIMDKAFEMRRRVIEDSESEEDEGDSDEEWEH